MKNLPLILNAILIAAVAFLFTKVYSKSAGTSSKTNSYSKDTSANGMSGCKIAYVELDSLNEQIKFIKDKKNELEAEQQAIENEFREGYRKLQSQSADFQKRAQTEGAVTQKEAEDLQNRLIQGQQELTNAKENKSQALNEKSYKFLEEIQKKLKAFLLDYNKDKKYNFILTTGGGAEYMLYKDESFNITDLVVKEMNTILNK